MSALPQEVQLLMENGIPRIGGGSWPSLCGKCDPPIDNDGSIAGHPAETAVCIAAAHVLEHQKENGLPIGLMPITCPHGGETPGFTAADGETRPFLDFIVFMHAQWLAEQLGEIFSSAHFRQAMGEIPPRIFLVEDVAERFDAATWDVQKQIRNGRLEAYRVGGSIIRIPAEDLERAYRHLYRKPTDRMPDWVNSVEGATWEGFLQAGGDQPGAAFGPPAYDKRPIWIPDADDVLRGVQSTRSRRTSFAQNSAWWDNSPL